MNKLTLKLSENELIEIVTDNNIDFKKIDFCCGNVKAYFVNEQRLRIGQQSTGVFFEALIRILKQVIDIKLKLHESLTQDLGFMYNDYFHDLPNKKPKFIMVLASDSSSSYWVGANYKIWNTNKDANPYVTTWMYNDHEGNIIFEVTKFYKWSMQEDDLDDPEFETFDEFMKDYKPLIHRVIPRDAAIAWLDQAMKVYRGFFSSEENYIRACKENNW